MFEVEVVVLLDIEPFVLNFPTQTPALICQAIHVVCCQGEIGHPLMARGADSLFGYRACFLTFNQA